MSDYRALFEPPTFRRRLAEFFAPGAEHIPFGWPPLRGFTMQRVGLVFGLCTLLAVRQSVLDGFEVAAFPNRLAMVAKIFELTSIFSIEQFASFLPMALLVTVVDNLSTDATRAWRITALALAVFVGALIQLLIYSMLFILYNNATDQYRFILTWFSSATGAGVLVRTLLLGGLVTAILYLVKRERAASQALHAARLGAINLDRQMAEARLGVLIAQIEPHFLFNTLATVKRLYDVDPGQGRMLLHALTTYLRSALPRMRNAFSTLRSETELARAYLDVLRLRMGHRLAVEINVPSALLSAEMPPMMLATLVENAIKHGLAARPSGGRVRIVARQDGDQLEVSVGDDGVGFQRSSGSGVGLANIRSRLASLYGARGQLRLAANREGGVTATLSLPLTAVTTTAVSS